MGKLRRRVLTCKSHFDSADNRSSLVDEDWIERDMNRPSANSVTGETGAAQRIREWRPVMTVNALATTQIGARVTPIDSLGSTNQSMPIGGIATMGFMTSREALSLLPAEQHNNINPRKRKLEPTASKTTARPKQTTLSRWINNHVPPPEPQPQESALSTKVRSTGIIQDRGKQMRNELIPAIPLQMSSPERGLDIDTLLAVSLSSSPAPATPHGPRHERLLDDLPTSPLVPTELPLKRQGFAGSKDGLGVALGIASIPAERRSLGIRRGMKPWSSKK